LPELRAQDGPTIIFKVVHIPFTFAPDPVGGTEIYVETLAHSLRAHGIESLIVAPSCIDEAYEHNTLRVRRYRTAPESKYMLRELYGRGDPESAAAFAQIIDEERPDAVHLHAFTRAVSLRLVRIAKQRGLPVFFTYHTPTVSCQRGSLMLWGKEMCDGVLKVRRCTSCYLKGRGLPRWATGALSYMPFWFARGLEKANLSGGIWTALRMPELVRTQHEAFYALMQEVDGIVALSEWARTVLVRNGVPASKITLLQHWLPSAQDTQEPRINVAKVPLRVAFLGRADKFKGADTLIKAVRAAPGLSVEVHLYGVAQSHTDDEYWAALKSSAAHDARIHFLPPLPHDKVVSALRRYHVLAVPSRWVENRPLVVLESFAAGTPVIGSNLGGIRELVRHQDDGLLVEAENVRAWADALRRCAEDRDLLARLRKSAQLPRNMVDVADEMAQLYHKHLNFSERPCSGSITTQNAKQNPLPESRQIPE
jgi:glycosyltransferase involved in cell wall biosynthesis